jgi:hypothetical protein
VTRSGHTVGVKDNAEVRGFGVNSIGHNIKIIAELGYLKDGKTAMCR